MFSLSLYFFFFFFFQAEDGIRDLYVTGVQTCALPIAEDLQDARDVLFVGPRLTKTGGARLDIGMIVIERFARQAIAQWHANEGEIGVVVFLGTGLRVFEEAEDRRFLTFRVKRFARRIRARGVDRLERRPTDHRGAALDADKDQRNDGEAREV